MPRSLITAPSVEPLSTAEAKDHLHVDDTDSDTLIATQIVAARQYCETVLRRAIITQTWDVYFDAFPMWIEVPLPRLQSVTSIVYIDTNGDTQTLDVSLYTVDIKAQPGRVVPAYGESWPSTRAEINAVIVRFVAGYGDAGSDIPEPIRQAGLLLLGHWFEHREDVVAGVSVAEMPMASRSLLAPYEIHEF